MYIPTAEMPPLFVLATLDGNRHMDPRFETTQTGPVPARLARTFGR